MTIPDNLTLGSMSEDDLIALRDSLLTEAEGLLTRAEGDLEGDDATRFAELETQTSHVNRFVTLARAIGNPAARESGTMEAPQFNMGRTRSRDPWAEVRDGQVSNTEIRGIAEACIERTERLDDASKNHAAGLLDELGDPGAHYIAAVSQPDYARGWLKLATDPQAQAMLTDGERQAIAHTVTVSRAASLTDNVGGYAVPFTLDPTLILTNSGASNPIRQLARTVTTLTDTWSPVTTAGVSSSWDGEAAEAADGAPTLAQPTITVHKSQLFVPFSIEIGQDWANIEGELRMAFADAVDRLEADAFVTGAGNGSNQPVGIITALDGTSSELAPTTGETFAVADLYKVAEALPERHWANASWVAHRGTGFAIRQFASSTETASYWAELGGDNPPRLLGKPFYESSAMDSSSTINAAATADNFILLLGDFQKYVTVRRAGLTVELVPHLFATANNRPNGTRGLYGWHRVGADSIDDGAFRVLNVATAA